MIITCSECSTGFRLDESLIKEKGSKVRCSICNHVFTVYPLPPEPEETAIPDGAPDEKAAREDVPEEPDFTDEIADETDFLDEAIDETAVSEPAFSEEDFSQEKALSAGESDLDFSADEPSSDLESSDFDFEIDDFSFEPDVEKPRDSEPGEPGEPGESDESDESDGFDLELDFGDEAEEDRPAPTDEEEPVFGDLELELGDEPAPEELDLDFELDLETEDHPESEAGEMDLEIEDQPQIEEELDLTEPDLLAEDDIETAGEADFPESDPDFPESGPEDAALPEITLKDHLPEDEEPEEIPEEVPDNELIQDDAPAREPEIRKEPLIRRIDQADTELTRRPRKKTKHASAGLPVLILCLVFLAVAGAYVAGIMTGYKIPYLSDIRIPVIQEYLESFAPEKPEIKPVPNENSVNGRFVSNAAAGTLFVITGRVDNLSKNPLRHLSVQAVLSTKDVPEARAKQVFCGNLIPEELLKTGSMTEIDRLLTIREGQNNSNINVLPGSSIPFMVVFSELPEKLQNYNVKVSGYEKAGAN